MRYQEPESLGEAQQEVRERPARIHRGTLISALNKAIEVQQVYEERKGYDLPSAYLQTMRDTRQALIDGRQVEIAKE